MSTLAERIHEAFIEYEQRLRFLEQRIAAGWSGVTAEMVELKLMSLPGDKATEVQVNYFVSHPAAFNSYLALAKQAGGPQTYADVLAYIAAHP